MSTYDLICIDAADHDVRAYPLLSLLHCCDLNILIIIIIISG